MLPDREKTRIHELWDELAAFPANESETALKHAMQVLSDLINAQHAFWIGAVRLRIEGDLMAGWRVRALRRLDATESRQLMKSVQQLHDQGIADPVTLAQVKQAGAFRVRLLRELAPPDFASSRAYEVLYRSRHIQDAIYAVFPVTADAESYFGWYRVGVATDPFSSLDRDVVAYALRALKWFHQRIMLHHGLLAAKAPLTSVERRLVSLLGLGSLLGRFVMATYDLVVELREKCEYLLATWGAGGSVPVATARAPILDDVASALVNMGWRAAEADKVLARMAVPAGATVVVTLNGLRLLRASAPTAIAR